MPQNKPHKHRTGWRRCKRTRPGEILDAAACVVQVKGHVGARMTDIAACAGISVGTIYLYFAGKEDLLRAIKV